MWAQSDWSIPFSSLFLPRFKALDGNNDGNMSREEFVTGLMSLKEIDITEIECERLFTVIDEANSGVVTSDNFVSEMHRYRWLKSVVSLYHKSKNCMFETKKDYDFTKSTNENYAFPAPSPENTGDSSQQLFFGEFADIRATRDYHWHCNYTPERQLWQDRVVKSCLGKTEPQARPWIVYSWWVSMSAIKSVSMEAGSGILSYIKWFMLLYFISVVLLLVQLLTTT